MTKALGPAGLEEPLRNHVVRGFTTLKQEWTAGQALASLRGQKLAEKIVYFYVTDAAGKLVGVVPTRRLLMSEPETPVGSIMVTKVIAIPDSMTVGEACEFFVLHRFLAFPVIDAEKRMVGLVDVNMFAEEVFDIAERQTVDDVFQLIGVRLARAKSVSAFQSFKSRFPWLLCNIGGGLSCAVLAGQYEHLLNAAIVLALFVPVVLALAESVSMQSMTITLHSLHESRIDLKSVLRAARQELGAALLLGSACGSVVGVVAWVWKGATGIALAIGGSIALAIVTACLLGVLLPTAVRMFRGDPKIAAGPIVLAAADVATLLFYFNMASIVLRRG